MKKISIQLSINELAAVQNWNRGTGCLEHNYFWLGLLVNHNVIANIISLDTIQIDDNIATIEYHAKNKSDLV